MIKLFSPAKVNLMLSVTGHRSDGLHSLVSLAAPLSFGDTLSINRVLHKDQLHCSGLSIPAGLENLILKAAAAYREVLGQQVFFRFELQKHIPIKSGLGGGSSNAAVALQGMNQLLGEPLNKEQLFHISAKIGSDCPFFIDPKSALILSCGEVIKPIEKALARRLSGQKLLLFYPSFGVDTKWAYSRLADGAPETWEPEAKAWTRLADFEKTGEWRNLLFNSFEKPVGQKYLSLPSLLEPLRSIGVNCLMSGSGSSCFFLYEEKGELASITKRIQKAWGPSVFLVETSII